MAKQIFPQDLKELLDVIRKGKLCDLRNWIKVGKRVRFPEANYRGHILREAIEVGFHTFVEELLQLVSWNADELTEALDEALNHRRMDLAELLLKHGASLARVDFDSICQTMDENLFERFLREGGDPCRENAFANALGHLKARPLLRFYRSFRVEFPALDDQAALALTNSVEREEVRWTAMLAWAGADPFRPVPGDKETFPVDPENCTTAASSAVWKNNPDLIKVLKLKPTPAQALELLDNATYRANLNLFRDLLKSIPSSQLNSADRGSCVPLESLVRRSVSWNFWTSTRTTEGETETIQAIELLLNHGARWNPQRNELRYIRRNLSEYDGRYIVQIIRLLLYTPEAADLSALNELCDTPKLRAKISAVDLPLVGELTALRKKLRRINGVDAKTSKGTAQQAGKNNVSSGLAAVAQPDA